MPGRQPADTGIMSDPFGLSDPLRGARRSSNVSSFLVVAVAVAIAATLAGAALLVMKRGGDAAADAAEETVATVDRANDAEAQATLQAAVRAALAIQAESGSLDGVTPEALAAHDPALTFTSEPSSDPTVVSVAVGSGIWGAATRSGSGSCLWVRLDAQGMVAYGAGPTCTGTAALSASRTSW
jgi:hypothetical protein